MMYLTLPVSMYFSFSFGKVLTANAAQCGHVIEAYSMMVMGALGEPIGMSSSGPFASSSSTEKVSAWARPPLLLNTSRTPTLPSTPSASPAEVLMTNCRRVIITLNLRLSLLQALSRQVLLRPHIVAPFESGSAFTAMRQSRGGAWQWSAVHVRL